MAMIMAMSLSSRLILERLGFIRALRQPLPAYGWADTIGQMIDLPGPHPQAEAISPGTPSPDRGLTLELPRGYKPTSQE